MTASEEVFVLACDVCTATLAEIPVGIAFELRAVCLNCGHRGEYSGGAA